MNAKDLSEGVEKAVWNMLYQEAMYTGLELEDKETVIAVAEALIKVATELTEDLKNE
jgi:hypothetical protein